MVRIVGDEGSDSVGLIREEVRAEHETQLRSFEALDAKAGIVLGFAGALAAIAPLDRNVFVDIGRMAAVAGALLALTSFWPHSLPILETEPLRDLYLNADPRFTSRRLLDTSIEIVNGTRELMIKKGRRLKFAMAVLVSATLLVGVGSLVR
jgi:hypothetical protein